MKHKAMMCLVLAFVVLSSTFLMMTNLIDAVNAPILSVVLSGTANTYSIPAQPVGSTFNVDVRVDGLAGVAPGVNRVSYSLTWDPTVLLCTNKADKAWLPSQSNMGDLPLNGTSGIETIGQIAFDLNNAQACTNASSVSATFTFQAVSTGSCVIGLQPSDLGVAYLTYPDSQGNSHSVAGTTTTNATYGSSTATNSSIHGPTADFTPVDGSTFKLGSSVILNASSSQPGKDNRTCPIINYAWSIECLNGTTLTALTGQTATFPASVLGTFRIILIVTAADVQNPSSPNYVSTSSTTAVIYVVSNVQSISVDVFTSNGGVGKGASSGTYGPLQVVPTYALVTNRNVSMPYENVMFTIVGANGTTYYRQGVTNESGIATIQPSFRLPGPNLGSAQTSFGQWSITASVGILGTSVNDTTAFTFSYLNGIENVVIPKSIQKGESLPIQLTVNNQVLSAQWSLLTITLFDQAGVPIGSSSLTVTQQAENLTVVNAAIVIPSWAFSGHATAYLCLFANSTSVPLAPETIGDFDILS